MLRRLFISNRSRQAQPPVCHQTPVATYAHGSHRCIGCIRLGNKETTNEDLHPHAPTIIVPIATQPSASTPNPSHRKIPLPPSIWHRLCAWLHTDDRGAWSHAFRSLMAMIRDRRWEGPFPLSGTDLRLLWQAMLHDYPTPAHEQARVLLEVSDADRGWMWDDWCTQDEARIASVVPFLSPSRVPQVRDVVLRLLSSPSVAVRRHAVHALAAWKSESNASLRQEGMRLLWMVLYHDPDRSVRLTAAVALTDVLGPWPVEIPTVIDDVITAIAHNDAYAVAHIVPLLVYTPSLWFHPRLLSRIDQLARYPRIWEHPAMIRRWHDVMVTVTHASLCSGDRDQLARWADWIWTVTKHDPWNGCCPPTLRNLISHEPLVSAIRSYGRICFQSRFHDIWTSPSVRMIGTACPALGEDALDVIESIIHTDTDSASIPSWVIPAFDLVWNSDAWYRAVQMIDTHWDRFPDDILLAIVRRGVLSPAASEVCHRIYRRSPDHALRHIIRGIGESSNAHADSPLPQAVLPWLRRAAAEEPHLCDAPILRRVWMTDPATAWDMTQHLVSCSHSGCRDTVLSALSDAWNLGYDHEIIDCLRFVLAVTGRRSRDREPIIHALSSGLRRALPSVLPDLITVWRRVFACSSARTQHTALISSLSSAWGRGIDHMIVHILCTIPVTVHPQIIGAVIDVLRDGWGRGHDRTIATYLETIVHHAITRMEQTAQDTNGSSYTPIVVSVLRAIGDTWSDDDSAVRVHILTDVMQWGRSHGEILRRVPLIGVMLVRAILAGLPKLGPETISCWLDDLSSIAPSPTHILSWIAEAVSLPSLQAEDRS